MTDSFQTLGLGQSLLRALAEEGYSVPTPIQAAAIPHIMAGRDLLGLAQTGTGKTAAFALPILHRLHTPSRQPSPRGTRVLVLAPTRELVSQIAASFTTYGRHTSQSVCTIFGGVGQGLQVQAMRRGTDVLVAAPGRLLDLVGQGHIDLSTVETLVLDEADRMLDMGFARDIKRILAMLPRQRHTLLFSATMPAQISELAASLLRNPARVEITPPSTTVERINQSVLFVDSAHKRTALLELVGRPDVGRAIVFCLMKHEANKVTDHLNAAGVRAEAIHGNKSQGARERALEGFKTGQVRVLVATDIAARGIDVDAITHVFNYDLPNVAESYVHRIGRTARAGTSGVAVSLCDAEQRAWLAAIEREIGKPVPVVREHAHHSAAAEHSTMKPPVLGGGGGRGAGRSGPPRAQGGHAGGPGRGDARSSSGGHAAPHRNANPAARAGGGAPAASRPAGHTGERGRVGPAPVRPQR